jgi:hypothetical protein
MTEAKYRPAHDNVEYTPYYGYMKGPLWTMWEGAGNDFDQAALLSDLLRAAGYETRFVIGTVEVEPEYMKMVLGVNTTEEALQLLWENYVPAELSNRKIFVEHVWVEAYIPYDYYRGYMMEGAPKTNYQWVPIDPSFVPYRPKKPYPVADINYSINSLFESIVNNATITDDYFILSENTYSLISQAASKLKNESDNWYFENVGPLHENLTREEFNALYEPKPPEVRPDIIPGTLPFTVSTSEKYEKIPSEFLHLIKIEVVEDNEVVLVFNIASANTVGNQITLDYIPVDDATAELINSQESIKDIPAYMLDYKPVLLLNSLPFAIGNSSVFGQEQELRITFESPNEETVVTSPLEVGNYYSIAFDLGAMPSQIIQNQADLSFDGIFENLNGNQLVDHALGRVMHLSLLSYFGMTDLNTQILAEVQGVRWWRSSPSVAVLGVTFNTKYEGSVPVTIEPSYTHIDLAKNTLSVQGNKKKKRNFVFMAGVISSSWEHALFETHFNSRATSAVNIIGEAAKLGIPVYHIYLDFAT